jgi:hypothetical protein
MTSEYKRSSLSIYSSIGRNFGTRAAKAAGRYGERHDSTLPPADDRVATCTYV